MVRSILMLLILAAVLLTACSALPSGEDQAQQPSQEPAEQPERPVAALETPWKYPIAPGIWYPGDGPLPTRAFKYYRVRCWPGCHDPNSQPRPHNY